MTGMDLLLIARTTMLLSDSEDHGTLVEQKGLLILRALHQKHGFETLYKE